MVPDSSCERPRSSSIRCSGGRQRRRFRQHLLDASLKRKARRRMTKRTRTTVLRFHALVRHQDQDPLPRAHHPSAVPVNPLCESGPKDRVTRLRPPCKKGCCSISATGRWSRKEKRAKEFDDADFCSIKSTSADVPTADGGRISRRPNKLGPDSLLEISLRKLSCWPSATLRCSLRLWRVR